MKQGCQVFATKPAHEPINRTQKPIQYQILLYFNSAATGQVFPKQFIHFGLKMAFCKEIEFITSDQLQLCKNVDSYTDE